MKKLTAFVLAATMAASMVNAEAHISRPPILDRPSTLPEDTAICFGSGAVIAAIATGVAAGPALIAVALCGIIVADARYHLAGGTHIE